MKSARRSPVNNRPCASRIGDELATAPSRSHCAGRPPRRPGRRPLQRLNEIQQVIAVAAHLRDGMQPSMAAVAVDQDQLRVVFTAAALHCLSSTTTYDAGPCSGACRPASRRRAAVNGSCCSTSTSILPSPASTRSRASTGMLRSHERLSLGAARPAYSWSICSKISSATLPLFAIAARLAAERRTNAKDPLPRSTKLRG